MRRPLRETGVACAQDAELEFSGGHNGGGNLEADDIGKVIATLLSDDCGWITAENIEISGGFNR